MKFLLKEGAKVDSTGTYGYTALMYASLKGHTEIVNLLLEKKPNLDLVDINGCTAFMLASQNNKREIVETFY